MEIPLIVKIKLTAVIAAGALTFWFLGWPNIQPDNPSNPISVVLRSDTVTFIGIVAGLSALCTIIAYLLSGHHAKNIAPLAVPAGLTVWAVLTQGFDRLLLLNNTVDERVGLFRSLLFDAIFWFIPIILSYIIIQAVACRRKIEIIPEKSDGGDVSRVSTKKQVKKGGKFQFLENYYIQCVAALLMTCVISLILLKILARTSEATHYNIEVSKALSGGQLGFALIASFMLATLAAHQLFEVPMGVFLFAPPIIAVISYLRAGNNQIIQQLSSLGISEHFVHISASSATILPLQFISFGTIAVYWGYWVSIKTRYARENDLISFI